MIRKIKTEAIVLRKRNLPNQDLLITLLSKEKGKITALGKGIKKITSKRLPHLQIGNLVNIIFNNKNNRLYIQETELKSAFSKIKEKEEKLPFFYFALFIVDRLLPEGQKEDKIFNELLKFFIDLSCLNQYNLSDFTRWINKIMKTLGYINKNKSYYELKALIENLIEEKLPEII